MSTTSRRRRGEGPPEKTLGERFGYALVGIISGGLLSLLIFVPLVFYLFEGLPEEEGDFVLLMLGIPGLLTAFAGLWGFIATDDMVNTLTIWWERFMDMMSPR